MEILKLYLRGSDGKFAEHGCEGLAFNITSISINEVPFPTIPSDHIVIFDRLTRKLSGAVSDSPDFLLCLIPLPLG